MYDQQYKTKYLWLYFTILNHLNVILKTILEISYSIRKLGIQHFIHVYVRGKLNHSVSGKNEMTNVACISKESHMSHN